MNANTNYFNNMEEYTKYLMEVEYQFYSVNNDAEALRLSMEAKKAGYSHCLFDYVVGFCFNNGKGGVPVDKKKAGQFFLASAESRDANGNLYNDKHADESRAILAEDYSLRENKYGVINTEKAIEYCNILIEHRRYIDDALLYLTMIFCMPQFEYQDITRALGYCNQILQISTNHENRARATKIKYNLESLLPKKKSMFGFFGKR